MSKQLLLQATTDFIKEYETQINDLQRQITELTVERDYYKELPNEDHGNLYILEYVEDNGEGRDTYVCFGVFSSKANALRGKLTLIQKHKVPPYGFNIEKYTVDHDIHTEIDVYHMTDEEHCETYTLILGLAGKSPMPSDAYPVKFTIDELKLSLDYLRYY